MTKFRKALPEKEASKKVFWLASAVKRALELFIFLSELL